MVERGGWTRARSWVVPVSVAAVVAVRLPYLGAPLTSDEGGFLVVASQWHGGAGSLYGAYWVDRPPLLIALFGLAHLLGGPVALRLLGCAAAAISVLLAWRTGRLAGGSGAGTWSAVATAGLLSTPLLDARQVSGELLALPFVLAGVVLLLTALEAEGTRRSWPLFMSGVLAGLAVLVKQNFIDVFVLAVVLILAGAHARRTWAGTVRSLATFGAGAFVAFAAVVGGAAQRGTNPSDLWYAIVTFRLEASRVIAASASGATGERLERFPLVLVASGALLVGALFLARLVRTRSDPLVLGAAALLSWETLAAFSGGSYWLHYLIGLVPGLALCTALVVRERDRLARLGDFAVVGVAALALLAVAVRVVSPAAPMPSSVAGEWLEHSRRPGDTAVVAYGQPNILAEAQVSSPYPLLWSLPVRVDDPHLGLLTQVLRGVHAPDWLLVWGGGLDTWGVRAHRAERVVRTDYREVAQVCGFRIYLRDGQRRSHARVPGPDSCT